MLIPLVGVVIAVLAVYRAFDRLWPDRAPRPISDHNVPEGNEGRRSPPAG